LGALAVVIAARILGRELSTSKDAVTELARDAIREVSAVDKVRIRVNPLDHNLLMDSRDLILAANPTVRGVEIVDDPTIEAGVKIESDAGLIDATIRTQLELALNALTRAA
jgi:flagellar biosynthesis/type III secretory pathway protein FliH